MTDEAPTLSPGLRRMWGLASPSRGGRQTLTVERVVAAAVDVADAEGLDAVSMSRVAAELGFTTMALYRHVESKEELLELMVDLAMGDPPDLSEGPEGWRDGLERWTWAQRDVARRRSWIAQAPIAGIPIGPHQVAWMEAALRALHGTPLEDGEKIGILALLAGQVIYDAVLTGDLTRARERVGQDVVEMERSYGRNLSAVLDPERFPELSAIVAGGLFDVPDGQVDPDVDFAFSLGLVLDGVELLIQRRDAAAG